MHKEGTKKCPKTLRTNLLCSVTYKERELRNLGRYRAEDDGRLYMSLENNFSTGGGGSWGAGSQRLPHKESARIVGFRREKS